MNVDEALRYADASPLGYPHVLAAQVRRLREHILDIDAHATPFGDLPEDPGYVGVYLVTAGALHRALGKVGRTAPSCEAEAELTELRAMKRRARVAAEHGHDLERLTALEILGEES